MKRYTRIVWITNVAAIILSYFFHQTIYFSVVLFLAIIPACGCFIWKVRNKEFDSWNQFIKGVPKVIIWVTVLSCLYTFFNFFIHMAITGGGSPEIVDGVYYLWNHGPVRPITEAEYISLRLAEARLFTGHPLAFSAIPMAYFSSERNAALSTINE